MTRDMIRVLITGSSGQLGAEIARQILARGGEVLGLDAVPGPYTSVRADVRDAAALVRAARTAHAVIHTASLHAPHVETRSRREFVETNVGGTLNVLEAAREAGLRRVVYTSTTSVYGAALSPREERAVWVTEDLTPEPRDIYDVTKLAAEALCRGFAREWRLSVVCLRVCRFFPEPPSTMAAHRLYRGADVRDIAAAHVLSLTAGPTTGFELYNVAGPYAFLPEDCAALWASAPAVIERRYPAAAAAFAARGWTLPERIDRVYASGRARERLGYRPRYGIRELLGDDEPPAPNAARIYAECGG